MKKLFVTLVILIFSFTPLLSQEPYKTKAVLKATSFPMMKDFNEWREVSTGVTIYNDSLIIEYDTPEKFYLKEKVEKKHTEEGVKHYFLSVDHFGIECMIVMVNPKDEDFLVMYILFENFSIKYVLDNK